MHAKIRNLQGLRKMLRYYRKADVGNEAIRPVFPKLCAAAHWCAVEDLQVTASPFKMLFVTNFLPKSRKCCHYRSR